jgi:hypothetical protein
MSGDWNVNGGRLWAIGATTALVGALAAAVVWLFATQVFDETLLVQQGSSGDLQELGVGTVLIVAFVMGLIAVGVWYLLLLFVPRGDLFFGLLGTLFLLISFVPLAQFDVSTANKLWLAAMHLTVYVFVVPILSGSVNRVATRRFR